MKSFIRRLIRIINTRFFISSIMIIIEIVIISLLNYYLFNGFIYFALLSYLISYIMLISLINKDIVCELKLPWIVVILGLPPFGTVLYLLIGRRFLSRREKQLLKRISLNDNQVNALDLSNNVLNKLKEENLQAFQKAYSIIKDTNHIINNKSCCTYFKCGEEFFDDLIDKIKKAKHYIFIEYFIVSEGYALTTIVDLLKQKVLEGVEVRFMYDDVGSILAIDRNFYKKLNSYGINAKVFAKYTAKVSASHNNRNHRKICVIDGLYAYTGGINLADEYMNIISKFGYWKDSSLLVMGRSVEEFVKMFLFDWDLNAKTDSDITKYTSYVIDINSNSINYDNGYYLPYSTGPKLLYKTEIAKNIFLNLINSASKYIYMTTPYIIIDRELTNALINASKRGIEVVLITPHIPDKKTVYMITKSSYQNLIENGVNIYEYEKGFIHAKNFISDDEYMMCSTINMDYRSLIHHYEDGLWTYKSSTLNDMKNDFINTMNESIKISKESSKQNVIIRILLSIMKIFFPVF